MLLVLFFMNGFQLVVLFLKLFEYIVFVVNGVVVLVEMWVLLICIFVFLVVVVMDMFILFDVGVRKDIVLCWQYCLVLELVCMQLYVGERFQVWLIMLVLVLIVMVMLCVVVGLICICVENVYCCFGVSLVIVWDIEEVEVLRMVMLLFWDLFFVVFMLVCLSVILFCGCYIFSEFVLKLGLLRFVLWYLMVVCCVLFCGMIMYVVFCLFWMVSVLFMVLIVLIFICF